MKPILKQLEQNQKDKESRDFVCYHKISDEEFLKYDKLRHLYVQNRQTFKKICKQEQSKHRPLSKEALDFKESNKKLLEELKSYPCENCNRYKKHAKNIEVLSRIDVRQARLLKEMERQRDIYWNDFLAHRDVLIEMGYLKDDYPTPLGVTTSQIRSENELFIAEIIFSNVWEGLTPAQLASVVCAITTEDLRIEVPYIPLSQPVRKTLNKISDIRRRVEKTQSRYNVEEPCYINPYFSALIEIWADGAEWEAIVDQIDMGEGDIVRAFKRTVDVLRQFTVIDNVPEELVFTAREAIDQIMREPVNIE